MLLPNRIGTCKVLLFTALAALLGGCLEQADEPQAARLQFANQAPYFVSPKSWEVSVGDVSAQGYGAKAVDDDGDPVDSVCATLCTSLPVRRFVLVVHIHSSIGDAERISGSTDPCTGGARRPQGCDTPTASADRSSASIPPPHHGPGYVVVPQPATDH